MLCYFWDCCSFAKSCPTLWDPVDCNTPGFPVLHYLPEFAQANVHWVGDAIQPGHPLSPLCLPALNLSQRLDFKKYSDFHLSLSLPDLWVKPASMSWAVLWKSSQGKELGFPGGSEGKVSACNAGDPGSIPRSGRFPWRRQWQPTPVSLPGKSHGQRSLVGYSPWGLKESDTTEQLHFHFHEQPCEQVGNGSSSPVRLFRWQPPPIVWLQHRELLSQD